MHVESSSQGMVARTIRGPRCIGIKSILVASLLPVAAPGQSGPVNGARVLLESVAGEVEVRPLTGLETADPRDLGAHLVRFEDVERPEIPRASLDGAVLMMVDGGRVLGTLRGGDEEDLSFELLGAAPLRVPIESMRSLVFPLRVPEQWSAPLEHAPAGDRLYLFRAGGLDRVDGAVESFTDDGVRFDSPLGSKHFPWQEVSALLVEALEVDAPAPEEGAPVTVDLIDGSRLRGGLVLLTGEDCRLRIAGGRGLRLPISVISEILVEDERLRFLSELEPTLAEEAAPFGDDLGMRWPHQRDRAVSGGPLRAGGRIWTRGLGVHAPSRLVFELGGEWRGLSGKVALDDEVLTLAARGSVRFRILADGELRWESPVMRGGEGPLDLPALSLAGVGVLVLEVDEATEMHVADRADWLHLLLRR